MSGHWSNLTLLMSSSGGIKRIGIYLLIGSLPVGKSVNRVRTWLFTVQIIYLFIWLLGNLPVAIVDYTIGNLPVAIDDYTIGNLPIDIVDYTIK